MTGAHAQLVRAPSEDLARYSSVAVFLHWAMAVLIVVNWPVGYFSEEIERQLGTSPVALHKSLGLTVLALGFVRLWWRLRRRPPPMTAVAQPWRRAAAQVTHWALYALMIALPLTGWLRTSAGKYPLTWFGAVELPKFPIAPGSPQATAAATSHAVLAWAMLVLVCAHVAAALHHHLWLRDTTLRRMMPGRAD